MPRFQFVIPPSCEHRWYQPQYHQQFLDNNYVNAFLWKMHPDQHWKSHYRACTKLGILTKQGINLCRIASSVCLESMQTGSMTVWAPLQFFTASRLLKWRSSLPRSPLHVSWENTRTPGRRMYFLNITSPCQ